MVLNMVVVVEIVLEKTVEIYFEVNGLDLA
jgi:hypothetical protein